MLNFEKLHRILILRSNPRQKVCLLVKILEHLDIPFRNNREERLPSVETAPNFIRFIRI